MTNDEVRTVKIILAIKETYYPSPNWLIMEPNGAAWGVYSNKPPKTRNSGWYLRKDDAWQSISIDEIGVEADFYVPQSEWKNSLIKLK